MPPISLSPIFFQKMLRLLKLNKELNLLEEDAFITNNGSPNKLLTYFTDSLLGIKATSILSRRRSGNLLDYLHGSPTKTPQRIFHGASFSMFVAPLGWIGISTGHKLF